jgi:ribosomal protein L32
VTPAWVQPAERRDYGPAPDYIDAVALPNPSVPIVAENVVPTGPRAEKCSNCGVFELAEHSCTAMGAKCAGLESLEACDSTDRTIIVGRKAVGASTVAAQALLRRAIRSGVKVTVCRFSTAKRASRATLCWEPPSANACSTACIDARPAAQLLRYHLDTACRYLDGERRQWKKPARLCCLARWPSLDLPAWHGRSS